MLTGRRGAVPAKSFNLAIFKAANIKYPEGTAAAPDRGRAAHFEVWNLKLLWSLELGIWSFVDCYVS